MGTASLAWVAARTASFTSWSTDELWLVHDTTTWGDGQVERRDGTARLLAADRIRLTYDDMLGGTEIQLHADGFTFSPYRMLVANPMLPIPVQIRAHDTCHWDATTTELFAASMSSTGRITRKIRIGR